MLLKKAKNRINLAWRLNAKARDRMRCIPMTIMTKKVIAKAMSAHILLLKRQFSVVKKLWARVWNEVQPIAILRKTLYETGSLAALLRSFGAVGHSLQKHMLSKWHGRSLTIKFDSVNKAQHRLRRHPVEQTSREEIYILLMPIVLKDGWYGFYKDYLVHYYFFSDFDQAEYLLKHQADKPRYIPEKTEFLKYAFEDYVDNDHWWDVRRPS